MADTTALAHVLAQVKAAKPELDAYAPEGSGWHKRSLTAVNALVPWLIKEAPGLRVYVEEVLNSPALLRSAWASLKSQIDAPGEVARIDELLAREGVLLAFVAGDTVSTVVTGYLLSKYPGGALGETARVITRTSSSRPTTTPCCQYARATTRKSERRFGGKSGSPSACLMGWKSRPLGTTPTSTATIRMLACTLCCPS